MQTRNCRRCNGTGREDDPSYIGGILRGERESTGVGQRALATKLGISSGFLCDLEKGRKAWTEKKIARYRQALRDISGGF